ncbi:sec-independent protein translocase protein TatA [Halarchaeum solikamskense]|uniref:Sec-independent protein translocase subunit TatA/TatB n=1 Tax=Halarchaeum nitratireducens TaxID=489913 RepID=UPI001B3A9B59|nr:twin-arginine translocase TatA/TatE family subunit [Halarchaeum solikamskense]MBP2251250.1 sec-independent protein translocase protein TatA [Halarchaeum solikamskense]
MALEPVAQLGIPGGVEVVVILLLAVLLFGANKIPRLARAAGQSIGEFKRGAEQSQKELEDKVADEAGDE